MKDFIRLKNGSESVTREDVDEISYGKIIKYPISPGNIYLEQGGERFKLLLCAGETPRDSIIQSLNKKGVHNFHIKYCINYSNIAFLEKLIANLKNSTDEQVRIDLREKFVSWFSNCFWSGEKGGSFLDLIIVLNQAFYCLPEDIQNLSQDKNLVAYHRSFRVASTLFSLAFILGHTDYNYLKELYNTALCFDIGLLTDNFSYHYLEASSLERQKAGGGISYLKSQNLNQSQVDEFINHPVASYEIAKKFMTKKFTNPELANLIQVHHECAFGSGFPLGLSESELLEIECLAILSERMIPFESYFYFENDGKSAVQKYIQFLEEGPDFSLTPVTRIIENLKLILTGDKEAA